MKVLAQLLLAIVFAAAVATAQDAPDAQIDGVIDLTPENFDEVIGDKPAFVEFYAPWCGHCKSLVPAYTEVGAAYKKFDGQVVIGKVDADKHRELGSRFGVTGFPTLKFFAGGVNGDEPEKYEGGRTSEDIVKFINGKTGLTARIQKAPSAVKELVPGNFDEIVDGSRNVLVEFFAPWCGHCKRLKPDYEKVAAAFRAESDCVVGAVDADAHRSLGSRFEVSGYPTIKFFPKGSTEPVEYSAGRDVDSFVEYLNEKCGTDRNVDGRLGSSAGVIAEVSEILAGFASASSDDQAAAVAAYKEKVADLTVSDKVRKFYDVSLKRVAEKGADYVTKEATRLEGMIESGSVTVQKADDFQIRINILRSLE